VAQVAQASASGRDLPELQGDNRMGMNEREMDKVLRDAMVYGQGFMRIDPMDIYKRPNPWRRFICWLKWVL
jgi:hypothetical protein